MALSVLQAAAVNAGATRQLSRLQQMADTSGSAQGVIQRAVIAHGPIDGLAVNLDTAGLDVAKQLINGMWNAGKRSGLVNLREKLRTAHDTDAHQDNNMSLQKHILRHLKRKASNDPEKGNSGWYAKWRFDADHAPADKTGLTQVGPTVTAPVHPTVEQAAAIGVRAWQAGDIINKINWKTVGLHLQGRMPDQDYVDHAVLVPGTDLLDRNGKILAVKAAIDAVAQGVRDGLDDLTAYVGSSYRAATVAPGVLGSSINVGDLIKDASFWSTSALKLSHKGVDFGADGTVDAPRVYYIITGSSGVFLPQYTNFEAGVREVLFKDQTIFRVQKIHNYHHATYFVHVQEVNPAVLPPAPVTKNSWTGVVNP